MRPIIGITPALTRVEWPHGTADRYATSTSYVNAVLAAGGLPIVLPPQDGGASELLDIVDGLLLSGGGDVEPSRYGDDTLHAKTYGIDPLRDRCEIALLDEAFARDTPVFCICRGIQVLNVALGGTLYQDVPDQVSTDPVHAQETIGIPTSEPGHHVRPAPDGPIAALCGEGPVGVNSFHHQSVRDLAPDLRVAATAEDGVIEAVWRPDRTFVLGVQWHPELMFERHPEHLAPFKALVEAARARRLVGSVA
jgi:putative glutamine amidotransferase